MRGNDGLAGRPTGRVRDAWWLPYAAGAAVSALVLAVMVWQVVVRGPFIALDWRVHEIFAPRVPEGALKITFETLSRPGQRWLTLPLLLAAGAWVSWKQHRLRPALAVLAGLGSAFLVGKTVKDGLARTPPYRDIDILHGVGEAFPSGHTANATLTWALLTLLFFGSRGLSPDDRWRRLGFLVSAVLVLIVSIVVIVLEYHWLSDIPGGWMVGFFALMVALLVLGPPVASSAEDDGARDRGDALTPPGESEPVGRGSAD